MSEKDQKYILSGFVLSQKAADEVEQQLKANPDNWVEHARLLNFYSLKGNQKGIDKKRLPHILWMIRNRPAVPPGYGSWSFNHIAHPEGAQQIRDEWIKALESDQDNLTIIQNAVTSLQNIDREVCERLLLRAKHLDPDNAFWSGRLAQIYQLNAGHKMYAKTGDTTADVSAERAGIMRELEATLAGTTDRQRKLSMLKMLVFYATEEGDVSKTRQFAQEMLTTASQQRDNDYGQTLYDANLTLAQLAFKEQKFDEAMSYLLTASETPGSHGLEVVGPDFELAHLLWDQGKQQDVKTYIENCRKFWPNDFGAIQRWLKQIADGQTPDFEKHQINAKSAVGMVGLAAKLLFRKHD